MAEQGSNVAAVEQGQAPPGAQLPVGASPELARVMAEMASLREASDLLVLQHVESKREARKAKIATALAPIRSAAGKRSVTKLTEASFMLEDVSDIWLKLGKEALEAGTRVATVTNVDRINTAIETQAEILSNLKLHIQAELGMHAAAAASPLGWKVVGFMEKHPELDKDRHGLDIDDLRAKEKQLMQHKRELSAACRGSGGCHSGGRGSRGSRGGSGKSGGQDAGADNPKKAKKSKGNMSQQTCYNCNELGHMSFNCRKPKLKKER